MRCVSEQKGVRRIHDVFVEGRKLFGEFEELVDCKRGIQIRLILPLSVCGETSATGMTDPLPREFKKRNNVRDSNVRQFRRLCYTVESLLEYRMDSRKRRWNGLVH